MKSFLEMEYLDLVFAGTTDADFSHSMSEIVIVPGWLTKKYDGFCLGKLLKSQYVAAYSKECHPHKSVKVTVIFKTL